MQKIYNKSLIPIARKLRKRMTREERRLWYEFLRDHAVKFTRQKTIGYYIVDFYAASLKLAIEIDGSHHFTEQGLLFDAKRDEFFKKQSITVLRISNQSIDERFEQTCAEIEQLIQNRLLQTK